MSPFANDVISGHARMLDTLRKSEVCANGALFVQQALFSDKLKELNTPTELSKDGSDKVVVLSNKTYAPDGMTALYESLADILERLLVVMNSAYDDHDLLPSARLAVITDGEDNVSKSGSQKRVWELVDELRQKEWLYQSIVIGLQNSKFDDTKLEKIRQEMNFSKSIPLGQDARAIRRAFQLASQAHPE